MRDSATVSCVNAGTRAVSLEVSRNEHIAGQGLHLPGDGGFGIFAHPNGNFHTSFGEPMDDFVDLSCQSEIFKLSPF